MSQDSRVSYANQDAPKPSLNNRDDQVNFLEEIRNLVKGDYKTKTKDQRPKMQDPRMFTTIGSNYS